MKFVLHLVFFLFACQSFAGIAHLLPKPQHLSANGEKFRIGKVALHTPVLSVQWEQFIQEMGGKIVPNASKRIEIMLKEDLPELKLNPNEGYILSVQANVIEIQAVSSQGVFWAMQTLRQLFMKGSNAFEGCKIVDYPAFRIRGFMQDVGRSYFSLVELKREIALLSAYKINVFHFHLTENQGWRLESKRYPQLNAHSSYERFHGKFYTLEEARDLVRFCKEHGVLLLPEIDMPGHSRAFVKATGYDMQSPEGMRILKELLEEVCETFEVPYIHIGTDEVAFTNPTFVPEMVRFLRSKGKKVVSWNPGWEYKAGEIDMTQLWSYRGKAQAGIPAVDSRFHYINHFDAFADLVGLYTSKILNVNHGSEDHAGAIIGLWHDRYIPDEQQNLIQNNFYPSMLALAERSWLGGGSQYFDKTGTQLPLANSVEFQEFADFEARMLWHKKKHFVDVPFAYVKQTDVRWHITAPFPNDGDLSRQFPPETEPFSKSYTFRNNTYETKQAIGSGIYLRHTWGTFVPAHYEKPEPNHTAYAYTYVYSPKKQRVGLWFSSQPYSRSEKDIPPPQGKWDYKQSKIWLNDAEIMPPTWLSQHTELSNEIPLTNENFEAREPLSVVLKKGWNKVLIKLPVGIFNTKEVRLVKWYFACAFVTEDGRNSVQGLIYSPEMKKNL